jgi:hypothetical protein
MIGPQFKRGLFSAGHIQALVMSALGQKRTYAAQKVMSALCR